MAIIPKESIFSAGQLKPATFRVWCLLCEVKSKNYGDVFLSVEKAMEAGISKSPFYTAINELESKGWIQFSKQEKQQKFWQLLKGFPPIPKIPEKKPQPIEKKAVSSNEESFSPNEESVQDFPQMRNLNSPNEENNSPNEENFSPNEESHIRNTSVLLFVLHNLLQETKEKEKGTETVPKKKTVPRQTKTFLPKNFTLTEKMRLWAKEKVPDLDIEDAHADFLEYWSNKDGAGGMKTDWSLTWQKGMRLQAKWQHQASAQPPKQSGYSNNKTVLTKEERDAINNEQLKKYVESKTRELSGESRTGIQDYSALPQ